MRFLKLFLTLIACLWFVEISFGWEEDGKLSDDELLALSSYITNLSWSPDGSKIAFNGYLQGFNCPADIYVVDIDTKVITNLTNTPDISENGPIVWSPDGAYLAYEVIDYQWAEWGGEEEIHHIWVIKADGSNRRLLNTRPCQNPVWSPDGEYILAMGWFSGPEKEGYDPILMRIDGEEIKLMEFSGYPLSWSPNGHYILYYDIVSSGSIGRAPAAVLYRYDLNSGEVLELTSPLTEDVMTASFFLNGGKIWFWNLKDDYLWVMNVDGSDKQRIDIYQGLPEDSALALLLCPAVPSPNGQKIAFIAWHNDTPNLIPPYNIYLINPDGTGLEQITFFTGFLAKGQNPNVFVKGKSKSFVAKAVKAKPSEKKGASSEGVQISTEEKGKIARNIPVPRQEAPMKEDSSSPTQAPLLAGGLSLSALGYAIWKFLKMLS